MLRQPVDRIRNLAVTAKEFVGLLGRKGAHARVGTDWGWQHFNDIKEPIVRGATKEHRDRPLVVVAGGERNAGMAQRGVDGATGGERSVEGARHFNRGVIADLILHGDRRGHALLHQGLRHAGEDVAVVGDGPFTGVEVGEA